MTYMYPPITDEWALQLAVEAMPTIKPEKVLQVGISWSQHAVLLTTLNYNEEVEWKPQGPPSYPDALSKTEEIVYLEQFFDPINDEVTIMGYGEKSKTLIIGYRPSYDDKIDRSACRPMKVINANLW